MPWGPSSGTGTISASSCFTFSGRSKICSPSDGVISAWNNAGTTAARINAGGLRLAQGTGVEWVNSANPETGSVDTTFIRDGNGKTILYGGADGYSGGLTFHAGGVIEQEPPAAASSSATRSVSGNVATLTTQAAHAFAPGNVVVVSGMTDATYDGTFVITETPSTTSLKYALTHGNEASTADLAGTITQLERVRFDSNLGPLTVDGYSDAVQLTVQGHSTQTNNIFLVENSAGTDLVSIDNSGNISQAANAYLYTSGVRIDTSKIIMGDGLGGNILGFGSNGQITWSNTSDNAGAAAAAGLRYSAADIVECHDGSGYGAIKVGNGTVSGNALAKANIDTTAVGNVGTGEDNLISYSLPASSLTSTGQGVRITAWGTTANNANAKTLKLYFGSVILTNSLTTGAAHKWHVTATVWRTGASAQDYMARLEETGAANPDIEIGTLTETDTNAITIKCTGEATNNDDIVQEGMLVEFFG